MATDGGLQMPVETAATVSDTPVVPTRVTDDDGHIVEIFPLPTDEPTLTLVTFYPFTFIGAAPRRFIVHARQTGKGIRN